VTYKTLVRRRRCTRCRRRTARSGRTKCGVCAKALKLTDAIGARRRRYGATPTDVQQLIQNQGGRCPICGRCVDDRSALDHEHRTKELRGVLCPHPCNSAIGKTDETLFRFEEGVMRYASHRRRVLTVRACLRACAARAT
jgi:Recombination endonuclease VII